MAERLESTLVEKGSLRQVESALPEPGPVWTPEQRDAIYSRGCDILVAAGAGAGKTAVLVERVIQGLLQEDGLDIERLLVVTFTEAAAAEMRERIRGALEERLRQEPANSRLQQQRPAAGFYFHIHSFCSRLLRRYFYFLGGPSLQDHDRGGSRLLKSELIDELLAGHYQRGWSVLD